LPDDNQYYTAFRYAHSILARRQTLMKHASIVVIGGGPAGLAASISAGRALAGNKGSVLLLEGNQECGKKLLLSGSGQCNFSNNLPILEFLYRLGKNANYLKSAYYNFDKDAFTNLLTDAGCQSYARPDGKLFPLSMKASDVRDALVKQAVSAGVTILYNARVYDLGKHNQTGFIINMENGSKLSCDKLIITTGGASYPQTGSDGKALSYTKSLGHEATAFRPHLGNVNLQEFSFYKKCAGISLPNVQATFAGKEKSFTASGDLLITHKGFSGPLILDNCHRLKRGMEIIIRWAQDAETRLFEAQKKYPKMDIINALWELPIPKKLLKTILEARGLEFHQSMKRLTEFEILLLATVLSGSHYTISRVESLDTAMASAGGIPLAEINAKTMQSRICPDLYFAGEIMDYALPSGGFNIQMAVSTGWLAGESAVRT